MPTSKYFSKKVRAEGYVFDSGDERDRFFELRLMQVAGQITGLTVHPTYLLQDKFRYHGESSQFYGKAIQDIEYEADFAYQETARPMTTVVEDVKVVRTVAFKLKMKFFLMMYPELDFRIIGDPPKKKHKDKLPKGWEKRILSDTSARAFELRGDKVYGECP
jgi:hypothetical protein